MAQSFRIKTSKKTEFIEITSSVEEAIRKSGVKHGIGVVYIPHTTAGVTINENADPAVVEDILSALNRMVPSHEKYQHSEGNSPAHIKAGLMGFSQVLLIENGNISLGTWQGIFFCEFDGPRNREVRVKVVEDP